MSESSLLSIVSLAEDPFAPPVSAILVFTYCSTSIVQSKIEIDTNSSTSSTIISKCNIIYIVVKSWIIGVSYGNVWFFNILTAEALLHFGLL